MSIDWRNRLERFRDTLRVLKESHETVYEHAVVQFDNPGDFHVGKFVPRFCVLGSNLIEQIMVPFADGRRHVHYIVSCDTDRSGHLVFRKQAAEMRATLERVPKSILPRFHFPSVGNGQTEGLLHWLYIVHWIGSERPRPSYGTYIQFLDKVDNFTQYADFSWWGKSLRYPGIRRRALPGKRVESTV
ncbi:MAG: hypothetical protein KatS3mg105_4911 [Gemmatales bacterium]|nr:MAG: hypothetical protein KatS3mg105_4911 [Gemmatales bacterium]